MPHVPYCSGTCPLNQPPVLNQLINNRGAPFRSENNSLIFKRVLVLSTLPLELKCQEPNQSSVSINMFLPSMPCAGSEVWPLPPAHDDPTLLPPKA